METEKRGGFIVVIGPLLCILIAAALCFVQYRRSAALDADISKTNNQIALVSRKLAEFETTPRKSRSAAALLTTDEQPAFVNWLRMTASFARVKIIKWTNVKSPAAATGTTEDKTAKAKNPLPRNVSALTSAVEVGGTYSDIREFLYSLLRAQRLLTMTGIQWTRDDKWPATKVTFTLTRYVTTIVPPPS